MTRPTGKRRSAAALADRVATLEAFLGHVCDVADTMALLGESWGGEHGEGLKAYARQLREEAQAALRDDSRDPGDAP